MPCFSESEGDNADAIEDEEQKDAAMGEIGEGDNAGSRMDKKAFHFQNCACPMPESILLSEMKKIRQYFSVSRHEKSFPVCCMYCCV